MLEPVSDAILRLIHLVRFGTTGVARPGLGHARVHPSLLRKIPEHARIKAWARTAVANDGYRGFLFFRSQIARTPS